MKRVEDPNKAFDFRHDFPCAIKPPTDSDTGVDVVRCESCLKMITMYEIQRYGHCPSCQGHRFRGAYPGKFTWDWLKIFFWSITRNWRVWGKEGWGWKNDSSS